MNLQDFINAVFANCNDFDAFLGEKTISENKFRNRYMGSASAASDDSYLYSEETTQYEDNDVCDFLEVIFNRVNFEEINIDEYDEVIDYTSLGEMIWCDFDNGLTWEEILDQYTNGEATIFVNDEGRVEVGYDY